jgi:hypothetical protein
VSFHTFSLPEDRCVHVLVKNLGTRMPDSIVKEKLEALGICVQGVLQLRSRSRDPDPLYGRGGFGYALFGAGLFGCSLCRGCRHFWRRLLTPGLLAGACHWCLLRGFSDLCRNGFGRRSGLDIGITTPSEHVVPAISEAQLFSGRLGSSGRRPYISGGCSASNYRPRLARAALASFHFPQPR